METDDRTAADEANGEEIEVEGEKVSKEDLARIVKDYRNDTAWKKANTERADEIARDRAVLAAERQAVAEERRANALRDQNRLEQPVDELAGLKQEMSFSLDGLPSPVDDEDGFRRGLTERTEQALHKTARTVLEIAGKQATEVSSEATRVADSRAEVKVMQAQVVAANEIIATKYFNEHPEITAVEQAKIRSRLTRDEEHGTTDPTTRYFRFNEAAFESADRGVRREYYDRKAKEAGFNEGLSQRERAARAGEHVGTGGTGRAPSQTAPVEDLAKHITSLPPGPAMTRYMDSLSPERVEELIRFQFAQEMEAAGQG